MSYCTTCGSQLQGQDYCTSCGSRVSSSSGSAGATAAPATVAGAPTQQLPPANQPPFTAGDASGTAGGGGRGGGGVPPWVLIASIVGVALVAVVVFVFLSRGGAGDTATASSATSPTSAATAGAAAGQGSTSTPSVAVRTVTATATATAPARPTGTPSAFVAGLYQDWSARNEAAIATKVSPAYVDAFPSSLLDGQGITRVESYNNVESSQNGATRVCGNQRFVKSDGESQLEYRCFLVTESNGAWKIIWTGDSETLQRWS